MILVAGLGDSARVEADIARGSGGLRNHRGHAISPIGEHSDWTAEPTERRAAFDAVAECVRLREPPQPPAATSGEPSALGGSEDRAPSLPWLLLLSLLGLGALGATSRPRVRRALELAALSVGTFLFRVALFPFAFFHQNGQGAAWVAHALHGDAALDAYGPGYHELLSALASTFSGDPDGAIFLGQASYSATVPALSWILARRAGARPALCWALAVIVAIDPSLGRIAHSESYFAVILFLLALAAVALAEGFRQRSRQRSGQRWRPWVGVVTAALLVSQAARVHPLAWIPASTIPLLALVLPTDELHVRLRRLATSATGIGAVVALTSGPTLLGVLESFRDRSELVSSAGFRSALILSACVGVVAVAAWRVRQGAWRVLVAATFLGVVAWMLATNPIPSDHATYQAAYVRLYLPALLGSFTAIATLIDVQLSSKRGRLALVALLLCLGGAHAGFRWDALTLRATDVHESQWIRGWRSELPRGASVVYLERAGMRVYFAPLYRTLGDLHPRRLSASSAADMNLPRGSYYYRSSLCSTPEGAAACREIEGRHRLERLRTRTLDPVASQPWLPLNEPARVALFRVVDGPEEGSSARER